MSDSDVVVVAVEGKEQWHTKVLKASDAQSSYTRPTPTSPSNSQK